MPAITATIVQGQSNQASGSKLGDFLNSNGNRLQSRTVYDDAGQAIESLDELGHISRTSYNAAGEAISSTIYDQSNDGTVVPLTSTSQYDQAGRTVRSTDALGRYSVPTYDNGGRVTFSRLYDRNGVQISESETHYDALGRVDYTVDASGHMKRMVYDNLSRLVKVIQASQGNPTASGTGTYDLVTSFGYDEVGHKIWQADANNRVTRFGYDIRGRQVWRKLPMGEMETMEYNVGGQLEKATDFRGFATTYRYDERGRMTLKTPDARLQETQLRWEYPDENTRISYRGAASVTQRYDTQRGWLNRVENKVGDKTSTVSYSYNPEGQKTATNTESGSTFYTYDVLGRLATVRDQMVGNSTNTASDIARYDYNEVGNLTSLERGNGVDTTYTFDEQNRLKTLANKRGTSVLSQFGYTVRGDGKRTNIAEQIVNADAGRVSTRNLAFSYDNAGKLTGEQGQNGLGHNYENLWTYDAVGNRTSTTAQRNDVAGVTQDWAHTTVVTSQFNENDQLVSQTSVVDSGASVSQSYTYDENGAEKTVANKSGNALTGSSVNGWDFEGKLRTTQAKDAEGAADGGSSNAFDAKGDRLWHVADVGKASQKTTSYVVDTDTGLSQVVEETSHDEKDSAGAARLQARYVWGQGLAPLAMWRRGSDGAFKLFYFVSDGKESVRQLTDTAGNVTDSYFYDAWGNTLAGGSGSTANPFRYTGQQLDSDGRYYLRARFYNPGNGRFLSHDPLMGIEDDPTSMHRYLYAGVDGVNACDPTGKMTMAETMVAIYINAQLLVSVYYGYENTVNGENVRAAQNAINYSYPDITAELTKTVNRARRFAIKNPKWLHRAGNALIYPETAWGAWDILQLSNKVGGEGDSWIAGASNPKLNKGDVNQRMVNVDGKTFHSYTVNYVIYGVMMAAANKGAWLNESAILVSKLAPRPDAGRGGGWDESPWGRDLTGALAWATAGYEGWGAFGPGIDTPESNIVSRGSSGVTSKQFQVRWADRVIQPNGTSIPSGLPNGRP